MLPSKNENIVNYYNVYRQLDFIKNNKYVIITTDDLLKFRKKECIK